MKATLGHRDTPQLCACWFCLRERGVTPRNAGGHPDILGTVYGPHDGEPRDARQPTCRRCGTALTYVEATEARAKRYRCRCGRGRRIREEAS